MPAPFQLSRHVFLEKAPRKQDIFLVRHALTRRAVPVTDEEWGVLGLFEQPRLLEDVEREHGRMPSFNRLIDEARKGSVLVESGESHDLLKHRTSLRWKLDRFLMSALRLSSEELARLTDRHITVKRDQLEEIRFKLRLGKDIVSVFNEMNYPELSKAFREDWIKRFFKSTRIFFDYFSTALIREGVGSAEPYYMDARICRSMMERPEHNYELQQQFCMPETSCKRAHYIAGVFPNGGKVFVLGDDDLVSLSLAPLGDYEIHVAEVDRRLVSLIGETGRKNGWNITVHQIDLREPLPEHLRKQFQIITSDPPYWADGMECFLNRAMEAFDPKKNPCRLFVSTNPIMMDDYPRFRRDAAKAGFIFFNHLENFNCYFLEPLWHQTLLSMMHVLGYTTGFFGELMTIPYVYADFFEMGVVDPSVLEEPVPSVFRARP